MNSKERVAAALERKPVDRVPVFMWFHPGTTRHLAEVLELPPDRVGEAMGNDVQQTWVNNNYAMEGIVHERDGDSHVDYWGIKWVKEGDFNQIAEYPLVDAGNDEVLEYRFPSEHLNDLLELMTTVMKYQEDFFIGVDVSPCGFEMYNRLCGMEKAIMDLALEPQLAGTMLGRCADFAVALAEEACDRLEVDWLWTGDDVGGQQSMMMSPDMWREFLKPHIKRVIDVGKAYGLPVAYHSCGAIRPIIGDLIEIGVDVLNPIQPQCPGMDPIELKREFGAHLAFMGGMDTQQLLPNGTVDDVRRATSRLVQAMTGDGGGFILAASHTIPPETPDENIFAMYDKAGLSKEEILDRAADIRRSLDASHSG